MCKCHMAFHMIGYRSIALEEIFLLRGPFGLGSACNIFKFDIILLDVQALAFILIITITITRCNVHEPMLVKVIEACVTFGV